MAGTVMEAMSRTRSRLRRVEFQLLRGAYFRLIQQCFVSRDINQADSDSEKWLSSCQAVHSVGEYDSPWTNHGWIISPMS